MTGNKKTHTKKLAGIGLMSAILCVAGPVSIALPFSPVPVSLGTLAVYFAAVVFGMKRGALSTAVYLLLGLAGLPVFAGFTGGPGKLFGPTGGYLVGYLFLAAISGFFAEHFRERLLPLLSGMLLATVVCYLIGTLWLAKQLETTFLQALLPGVVPYLPFDFLKLIAAAVVGLRVRKQIYRAGL